LRQRFLLGGLPARRSRRAFATAEILAALKRDRKAILMNGPMAQLREGTQT
jgi:hypothetical protein